MKKKTKRKFKRKRTKFKKKKKSLKKVIKNPKKRKKSRKIIKRKKNSIKNKFKLPAFPIKKIKIPQFRDQISKFIDAVINNNTKYLVSAEDGAKTISVCEAALKSLQIKRSIKDDASYVIESFTNIRKVPFAAGMPDYKISFSVVAANINEAIKNHSDIQKLLRMIYPPHNPDGSKKTAFPDLWVKFGNIINNGSILGAGATRTSYTVNKTMPNTGQEDVDVGGFAGVLGNPQSTAVVLTESSPEPETETMITYKTSGKLLVLCRKVSYKPDINMGFFEHRGMLFAKTFDMSLSFESRDRKSLRQLKNKIC